MTTQRERELEKELSRLKQCMAEKEQMVSRQRQMEADLKAEREFCETVLNSMRDAIYVVTAEDYKIIDCNQVFLERYGCRKEEVIGRTCYEVKRGLDVPCIMVDEFCPCLDSFRTKEPSRNEWIYITREGREIITECTALPVFDAQGRVPRIVHIDRDISHRKRYREKLEQINRELSRSNAFLRNLINSSVDAVIASDMSGRILIFNQAAGQITGYSEKEALEELDIRQIYPGEGAREVMRCLRSPDYGGRDKLKAHDTLIRAKDGTLVPIRLSAAVVKDGDQEVATVGFFYDLRERLQMERELEKTRMQLIQAEKMASLGKLAAGVAHQLNNPLSGITLFARILLEEYDLEPQAAQDVERILLNAERSRETIQELLQFARQTQRDMRPTDLNQALSQTIFLLEKQTLFKHIELERHFDPELPLVPADGQQLNHVFMNIILNAADAMEGRGVLTLRTGRGPEGKTVLIEISDTGPGIPPEVLPHLFEPFYTTKEEGEGTGLGLSVAYGIIENHRGRIWAQNRPQGGASFFIELPLAQDGEESHESGQ